MLSTTFTNRLKNSANSSTRHWINKSQINKHVLYGRCSPCSPVYKMQLHDCIGLTSKQEVSEMQVHNDGVLRVFQTPNGPQVFLGSSRIHHWMPGVVFVALSLLGAVFDDRRENRGRYIGLGLAGLVLVLDDLPDFISFIQGKQ